MTIFIELNEKQLVASLLRLERNRLISFITQIDKEVYDFEFTKELFSAILKNYEEELSKKQYQNVVKEIITEVLK